MPFYALRKWSLRHHFWGDAQQLHNSFLYSVYHKPGGLNNHGLAWPYTDKPYECTSCLETWCSKRSCHWTSILPLPSNLAEANWYTWPFQTILHMSEDRTQCIREVVKRFNSVETATWLAVSDCRIFLVSSYPGWQFEKVFSLLLLFQGNNFSKITSLNDPTLYSQNLQWLLVKNWDRHRSATFL
jgi:hypothetical protein